VSEVRLLAEIRTEFGKGGARRTRRAGKIPAVLYGHGTDPRHLSLPARDFSHALKGGANTVLTLQFPDGDELALPKSVVRHPLRDYVEHVDLLLIRRGEKVTVDIPVTVVGESAPGTIHVVETQTLSLEAEATHLPNEIEVSIEGLTGGSSVTAGEITLPEGSTLLSDPDQTVVAISVPHASADDLAAEAAASEIAASQSAASAAAAEA